MGGRMITVSDIMSLPSIKCSHLVAPCVKGEHREVINIGILDVGPSVNQYQAYMPGEFILTNLGFTNGDKKESETALLTLMRRNVSGIGIKTVYKPYVSEYVCQESTKQGIPIYLYDGAYFEFTVYEALDAIRKDALETKNEKKIEHLINKYDSDEVCRELFEIADVSGKFLKCFAFSMREKPSHIAALESIKKELQDNCDLLIGSEPMVQNAQAHRFHSTIIVFLSLVEDLSNGNDFTLEFAKKCIANSDLRPYGVCGVSDAVLIKDGDLAIREALAALSFAMEDKNRILAWSSLGKKAFEVATRQDRLFSLTSKAYREILLNTDNDLCTTAEAFVKSGGNISNTSELLCQHPNTIRYRLKKIREKLKAGNISDRELLVLLTLIWLGRAER